MTMADPATGLPELPEGQWWEVRESKYPPMYDYGCIHLSRDYAAHEVAIRTQWTFTIPGEFGKHWWSKSTPAVTTTEPRDVANAYIDGGLTPRSIRKAAYGLVERRNRKAKQDALLGVYPPKKLKEAA